MAISAELGQNLQPSSGNGDVSKWVKNSRVGRNTPKKTNQIKSNARIAKKNWHCNFNGNQFSSMTSCHVVDVEYEKKKPRYVFYSRRLFCLNPSMLFIIIHDGINY